ncbi:MAG: radical SAM family heme chaperone HemW [Muribaculaceae bacterium]|nr:radical SAM family heme chaperone HemW [Muribaculaceae bacterium]
MTKPISLYFHIPYCRKKCAYCDFYSGGVRIADWKALNSSFIRELKLRAVEWRDRVIVSIYFGGGTPSLMPPEYLENLANDIRKVIDEEASLSEDCEFTLEANPEDINDRNINTWKRCGINRISLGIQTFDNAILTRMGRTHTGEEAISAFRSLRNFFDNISTDLIFGLPDQTLEDLRKDLKTMLSLHPNHISIYSLMYEPGTSLTLLRDKGKVKAADEEMTEVMFQDISATLAKAGYIRYETSNYALPGYESRHNSGYWTGRAYIGIGPSAHSYDGELKRKANSADLKGYLLDTYNIIEENLTQQERIEERIMLGLRMKKGIDLVMFQKDFGAAHLRKLLQKAEKGLRLGNLAITDDHLRVSEKGIMISDTLIVELF